MSLQGVLKHAAVLALGSFLTACAWGPGMRVNTGAIENRVEEAGGDPKFVLVPITPEVVREQLEASLKRPAPNPDPLKERAENYEYNVAPHDVLSVIVWGHPELTIPAGEFRSAEATGHPVTADGKMFYPHVGTVEVAGKTLPEIRQLLTTRLKGVLQNPQLDVKVASYRGMRVRVTGEVKQPTTFPVTDVPMYALDAIALAGGETPEADLQTVTLTRNGKAYKLDLQAVNEFGDPSENWLLQDGDTLHVPDRMLKKVFVLGEVKKPSSRLMHKGRMTLAEAIGDTEGLDPMTANAAGIYVIRGSYEVPRVFQLDATSPDALLLAAQFPLHPLDVVFVSTHKLTQWNRIVLQILPTIQAVTQPFYYFRGDLLLLP